MIKRFLHLADLHIGKKLVDYSLLDAQRIVLNQAVEAAVSQQCDAVIIAGDVYDKPNPSAEAMALFDEFLTKLSQADKPVIIISGNHDAPGKISYFGKLLQKNQITVSAPFDGTLQAVKSPEEEIQIYLLPFITPTRVRQFWKNDDIETYQDAVKAVIQHSDINPEKINILVSHQYITEGEKGEEEFAVGGLDNIDANVFDAFDYVALGHLHKPQSCSRETIRYPGSPLKYSLSEETNEKTFTIVEVAGKQDIKIREVPVVLPCDIKTVQGSFAELRKMYFTDEEKPVYVNVILTDDDVIQDARLILRSNFPYMLKFTVQGSGTSSAEIQETERFAVQSPLDMFCMFYQDYQGEAPTEAQLKIVRDIFEKLQAEKRELA